MVWSGRQPSRRQTKLWREKDGVTPSYGCAGRPKEREELMRTTPKQDTPAPGISFYFPRIFFSFSFSFLSKLSIMMEIFLFQHICVTFFFFFFSPVFPKSYTSLAVPLSRSWQLGRLTWRYRWASGQTKPRHATTHYKLVGERKKKKKWTTFSSLVSSVAHSFKELDRVPKEEDMTKLDRILFPRR